MSDPRTDPNSEQYDEQYAKENPPPYSPGAQPGVEAPPQEPPSSAQQAAQGEQSTPSGEQDSTLPGETPETSTQIPKEGETTSAGGKSPLKFDPNAPAVPRIADPEKMRVEGELDPNRDSQGQIYSSAIGPERDPEKAWQEYAQDAANSLYPRLRNGVDYAIGRRSITGDMELLSGEQAGVNWGEIEKHAKKLSGQDPYSGAGYKPQKPLHAGQSQGREEGERHHSNFELPGNVAQSEVNPKTDDKVPSQAYPPPPPTENPHGGYEPGL